MSFKFASLLLALQLLDKKNPPWLLWNRKKLWFLVCALHVMADVFFPLSQMCMFFFVFIIFNFCALHHSNVMCAVWCAHFHVYVYDAIQFQTICGRWIHYSRYTATIWAVRRPIITISQFYAFVVSHYSCSHWLSIGSKSSLYHEQYMPSMCYCWA